MVEMSFFVKRCGEVGYLSAGEGRSPPSPLFYKSPKWFSLRLSSQQLTRFLFGSFLDLNLLQLRQTWRLCNSQSRIHQCQINSRWSPGHIKEASSFPAILPQSGVEGQEHSPVSTSLLENMTVQLDLWLEEMHYVHFRHFIALFGTEPKL